MHYLSEPEEGCRSELTIIPLVGPVTEAEGYVGLAGDPRVGHVFTSLRGGRKALGSDRGVDLSGRRMGKGLVDPLLAIRQGC